MIIKPIIPIWLMTVICVVMLLLKRKGRVPYIRQIIIVILMFAVNLRIMIPSGEAQIQSKQMEADVLFVVDDTISMVARDYNGETERLTAVKEDCKYIIDKLYGARFAVISFNNKANMLSPFTDDADYANSVIRSIYPIDELYATGSSMNVCKDILIDTTKKSYDKGDRSVVVFFISDGEITNGEALTSFKDAAKYIDNGAVLGYGTKEGGEMYVQSYFDDAPQPIEDTSDYPYKPAKSKIDEDNLTKIASDLDIDYINMNQRENIDEVIQKVQSSSKTSLARESADGYTDVYYIFVVPLLLLLIYEFVDYRRRG